MSDYDNTNSGALYNNKDDWKIIQQGKMNIDGTDQSIIGVKRNNRSGEPIVEIFRAVGTLKANTKEKPSSPDATGVVENIQNSGAKRIAAWRKTDKNGNPFTSLAISEFTGDRKEPDTAPQTEPLPDDEIPF